MDSPATIGTQEQGPTKPAAYMVVGPHSGAVGISVTLTLVKMDGLPWIPGDSVLLSDGEVDSGSIQFDKGSTRASAEYVPFSMGTKNLTGFNNRGWNDAPPFIFTVHPHSHSSIAAAVSIGL